MDKLTKAHSQIDTARVMLPNLVAGDSNDKEFRTVMQMVDEASQRAAGADYVGAANLALAAAQAVVALQTRCCGAGAAMVSNGHLDQAFGLLAEAERELGDLGRK